MNGRTGVLPPLETDIGGGALEDSAKHARSVGNRNSVELSSPMRSDPLDS